MTRALLGLTPALLATYLPFCAAAVQPTRHPSAAPMQELWSPPDDIGTRDLFHGPWGAEHAPDPHARYTLVERKHSGVNPGMTVRDPEGREWSVKQAPPDGLAAEGPIEVALSRILSAAGYHQPPVYYLPSFTLVDDWGPRATGGGRFRLKERSLKDRGNWSWQQNPFVGTRPYQGLLVILLLFNSTDLKNSNNTLYEHRLGDRHERWYVVRDLGAALGSTGRFAPRRGDPAAFERWPFVAGLDGGFVRFHYHGWHQELVRDRLTPADVVWAGRVLARLSDAQLDAAFRAGGIGPAERLRFCRAIRIRMAQGMRTAAGGAAAEGPAAP